MSCSRISKRSLWRRGGARAANSILWQGAGVGSTPPETSAATAIGGPAVAVSGLRREYGERTALAGIDFELGSGKSLLVLGPNGAGKTTLLRILATLLRPSGGEARVLGCALPREAWRPRGRGGSLGHEAPLDRDLSA